MEIGNVLNHQQAHNAETHKVARLVDYLLRLATLRTKLIRDIGDYEKVLWLSSVPHERGCFTQTLGRDEEHEPDEWLEVQNRREPELPAVPAQCKDWVNLAALRNKDDLPELLPEIIRQIPNPDWREGSDQPETIPHKERLEEHPEVQRVWDRYVEDKWLPWTEGSTQCLGESSQGLFRALCHPPRAAPTWRGEYELVIGLGLLTWQTPTGQRVRRHLVVADAILEFETRLSKFTVRPHPEGTKLRPELDMLDIEEQPARAEETAKTFLTEAEDDPWEKDCVEGVLQSLVHSINSQGEYEDSLEAKNTRASDKPIVEYAPALILRKRSAKGLTETLKRIREQIEHGEAIPGGFADLAEIRSKDGEQSSDELVETKAAFDGEIFFPKPSNDEQRRIVDKLRASSGVLVQGPPGTGKSHTIANLICHLLATGQRTLITAKTPRALQVPEEKISGPPLILWNHRWEYDKNPAEFFRALYLLQEEGRAFNVAILGESFGERSPIFKEARSRLGEKIVHFGFARNFAEYAAWLWRADILPVHSIHDFFGASVIQAMHCRCYPLLPQRLAYPEHIPQTEHARFFYTDFDDLLSRLRKLLNGFPGTIGTEVRRFAAGYDWSKMIERYDDLLDDLARKSRLAHRN